MKTNNRIYQIAGSIMAALAIACTAPLATADDKVKIKGEDGEKVKIKGDAAEEAIAELMEPEVAERMVVGYQIPVEQRTYFRPVPAERLQTLTPVPDQGTTVRVYNGTAYYMDNDTWEIRRTVPFDTATTTTTRETIIVE